MEKIIIKSVGNILLFSLLGLAFLFPLTEIQSIENVGFRATISIYPILLAVYLIVYPIIYYILSKKLKWSKKDVSELAL